MWSSGSSCLSNKSNHLTSLYLVAHINEVLRVMAIPCLKSILMTYLDEIAVCGIFLRHYHLTVESSKDIVVGSCLDIHTRMLSASSSSVLADHLGSWQGIECHFPVFVLLVATYHTHLHIISLALA